MYHDFSKRFRRFHSSHMLYVAFCVYVRSGIRLAKTVVPERGTFERAVAASDSFKKIPA